VTVSFPKILLLAAAAAVLAELYTGCGKDESPAGPNPPDNNRPDSIPPSAVTDLRLRSATSNSFALVWTAPGDDVAAGTAAAYDIRFSMAAIDSAAWDAAARVDPSKIPCPKPCGSVETIVVLGLQSATRYYFALKSSDDRGNESPVSNCASGVTLEESVPPAKVGDLAATALDDTTCRFVWTATGDDWMAGTASGYEIRYSRDPIENEAAWQAAATAGSIPATKNAGETETATLTSNVFREDFFFALKAVDDTGNWSSVSNSAAGMAFSQKLWVYPLAVTAGEITTVRFRSTGPDEIQVGVHSNLGWNQCFSYVIEILAEGQYPVGVHEVTCDFIDPASGRYLPDGGYFILYCRDGDMAAAACVEFER
jgi:hypothetical protein